MTYATVQLEGKYLHWDGVTPAIGTVEITPSERIVIDAAGDAILTGRVTVELVGGEFSVELPATDDPTLNPTGFGYTVSVRLYHQNLPAVSLSLPAAVPVVDMSDVTGVDPSTFAPAATYVSAVDLAAVDADVTALETTVAAIPTTYVPLSGNSKQITGPIFWRGGTGDTPVIAKPLGDGKGGVFDITHDDATGYLFHTHSGPNSGVGTYHYGGGADQGSGGVFLFAAKNAGKGLSGTSHPSHTGVGVDLSFYSAAADSMDVKLYSGARGVVIQQKTGKGYPDGVTTLGSTTFTSATAAFAGGDVGQSITQLTSRGEGYGIDTGTTIASVTNATTVVLSKPALLSATGINFFIAGRAVPTTQKLLSIFNSSASELFSIAPNLVKISNITEIATSAAANVNSVWFAGSVQKFYTYSTGTDYVASQLNHDTFGLRIEHFAAAGKGSESGSVRSFIGRNVGGVPYVGFLGASAVARQVVGAAATDAATTQTLANNLRTALINLGLASA